MNKIWRLTLFSLFHVLYVFCVSVNSPPISLYLEADILCIQEASIDVSSIRLQAHGLDKIWVNISVEHGLLQIPIKSNLFFKSINSTIGHPSTTSYARVLVDGAVQYEFIGTVAAVQKSLSRIVYAPFEGYSGLDTLSLSVAAKDSNEVLDQTSQIIVVKKNRAPQIISSTDMSLQCNESSSVPIVVTVVDDSPSSAFQAFIYAQHGSIVSSHCNSVDGDALVCNIQASSLSSLNSMLAAGIVYVPDTGYNVLSGLEEITLVVDDGDYSAVGGNLSALLSIAVSVSPLVTDPSVTLPSVIQINEDDLLALSPFISLLNYNAKDVYNMLVKVKKGYLLRAASVSSITRDSLYSAETNSSDSQSQLSFNGSISYIKYFLKEVYYLPSKDWSGLDHLSVSLTPLSSLDSPPSMQEAECSVIVEAVNDLPSVHSPLGSMLWGTEGQPVPLCVSTAGADDCIGISFNDVESGVGADLGHSPVLRVTVHAENGLCVFNDTGKDVYVEDEETTGIRFLVGNRAGGKGQTKATVAASPQPDLVLIGDVDSLNFLFQRLFFIPVPHLNVNWGIFGKVTVSVDDHYDPTSPSTWDMGGTHTIARTVSATVKVLLSPVNDAPVIHMAGPDGTVLQSVAMPAWEEREPSAGDGSLHKFIQTYEDVPQLIKGFSVNDADAGELAGQTLTVNISAYVGKIVLDTTKGTTLHNFHRKDLHILPNAHADALVFSTSDQTLLNEILANAVTYLPRENHNGEDFVRIKVSDGKMTSIAYVTMSIQPLNDAPLLLGPTRVLADSNLMQEDAGRVAIKNVRVQDIDYFTNPEASAFMSLSIVSTDNEHTAVE
jgi:hypothetical protein